MLKVMSSADRDGALVVKYGLTDVQLDALEQLWVAAHGCPFTLSDPSPSSLDFTGDLQRAAALRKWGMLNGHLPMRTFSKHNHYDPEDLESIYRHYNPLDTRTWPYYPIVMPLKDGLGPANAAECDKITWEVWDRFYNSVYSSEYLPHAINEAMRLNKEVFK
jgi:hypothetical protein